MTGLKEKKEYAIKSEAQEKAGGNRKFDKFLEVMCLRPISFILRSTVSPLEKSIHIFVVESSAVRWPIGKFINQLVEEELTVIFDCSGLQKIF